MQEYVKSEPVSLGLWANKELTDQEVVINVFRSIYDAWELGGRDLRDKFYKTLLKIGWPLKRIEGMEKTGAKTSSWAGVGWSEASACESLIEKIKKVSSLAELEVLAKDDPSFVNVIKETVFKIEGIKYSEFKVALNRMKQLALQSSDKEVLDSVNKTIESMLDTTKSVAESWSVDSAKGLYVSMVDKSLANQVFNLMKGKQVFSGDFKQLFKEDIGATVCDINGTVAIPEGRIGIVGFGHNDFAIIAGKNVKEMLDEEIKGILLRVERMWKQEKKDAVVEGLFDGKINIK